jgi:hypothetical protein
MLSFLKAFLPNPKIRSLAALQQFLDREAAFLAQRSVIDYARNELGALSAQAFDDQRFQDKLAVCRWQGYVATLADMIVLAHARLLAAGAPRAPLEARLVDLYVAVLGGQNMPAHRSEGWSAEIEALRTRLALRTDEAPSAQAYATKTGAMVFETLPFAPRDKVENRMVLCNAFAFGLIAFHERLARLLVPAPLCRELAPSP